MIRRLRWKFVAILTATAAVFLGIIFTTLYFSTKANFEHQSMGILQMELKDSYTPFAGGGRRTDRERPEEREADFPAENETNELGEGTGENGENSLEPGNLENEPAAGAAPETSRRQETETQSPPDRHFPILVAEKRSDGAGQTGGNRIYHLEEADISSLTSLADAMPEDLGILKELNLRCLRGPTGPDGTTRYVFADIYQEQYALRSQVFHSAVIGVLSLAAFFAFSILLSRWITRPIDQAWKMEQQFVSDASHELKTPLTVILSNISLLKQSPHIQDGNDRLRIDHIHSEAGRMKQLTEGLLQLARSDYQGQPAASSLTPVDFSYLAESCISTFEPLAFEMGKSISGAIEPDITVKGDEGKLRQLLSILLDNGCKYSAEGTSIEACLKREGSEAVLTVANEGTPLAPEELGQLFHRFYRADPSRGSVTGFGLGLSIAQCITAEHGGKISASTDGVKRNFFTVRLPLKKEG